MLVSHLHHLFEISVAFCFALNQSCSVQLTAAEPYVHRHVRQLQRQRTNNQWTCVHPCIPELFSTLPRNPNAHSPRFDTAAFVVSWSHGVQDTCGVLPCIPMTVNLWWLFTLSCGGPRAENDTFCAHQWHNHTHIFTQNVSNDINVLANSSHFLTNPQSSKIKIDSKKQIIGQFFFLCENMSSEVEKPKISFLLQIIRTQKCFPVIFSPLGWMILLSRRQTLMRIFPPEPRWGEGEKLDKIPFSGYLSHKISEPPQNDPLGT